MCEDFVLKTVRVVLFGAAALLSGCSDQSADLQRQLVALREEFDRSQAELQNANRELSQLRSQKESAPAAAASTGGVANREQLDRSYEAAARDLRGEVEKQVTDVKMENFTFFKPQYEEFPHRSEFSMEVRIGDRKVQIDRIPVKTSVDGKWVFPTATEVAARIERAKSTAASAPASTTTRPHPAVAVPSGPTPATQTVVIQWDPPSGVSAMREPDRGAPPPPSALQQPSTPQQPSAPSAQPSTPNAVMPVQRDVQIKF